MKNLQKGDLVRYDPIKNNNRARPLKFIDPKKIYKVLGIYKTPAGRDRVYLAYKGVQVSNSYSPRIFQRVQEKEETPKVENKPNIYAFRRHFYRIIYSTPKQTVIEDHDTRDIVIVDTKVWKEHATIATNVTIRLQRIEKELNKMARNTNEFDRDAKRQLIVDEIHNLVKYLQREDI